MPRKSLASINSRVRETVENFESVSELKFELAREAYDVQDEETQRVIDRILATLQTHATGYITVQLQPPHGAIYPVKISNEYLTYNLLWLAMEVVKDLALLDIRVASFEFPPSLCTKCGAEIIPEKKPPRKGLRT